MIKQLMIIGVAVMSTLLALVILWDFRIVVVYVLLSLALAATVRPLVTDWQSRGFKLRVGLTLLYMIVVGILGWLIFLAGKYVAGDIQQISQTLSVQDTWHLPVWMGSSSLQESLTAWLPTPNSIFEVAVGEQNQFVLPAVLSFTEGIGGLLSGFLLVLILSVYWSTNQSHFERLWLSLLPSEERKLARNVWRTIELEFGAYMRSEMAQSFLAALLLTTGYWVLGCPYPVLLGVLGGLAWLIPVVGAPLAMILPLFVGLSSSLQLGLFATLYTLIVLVSLQVWAEPRLFRRQWDNPILTLILILALGDVFGLIGVLVAPPLSAICRILWNSLVRDRLISKSVVQVSDLKQRHAHLWNVIEEMKEEPPLLVINSMQRLAALLEKAEPVLPEVEPLEDSPVPFHPSQPVVVKDDSAASNSK
jgi:predicted PurR-regulated permease PerM